jgi:hypothetical protein
MQKYFATISRNLHLNSGANGDAIGSPFKCKMPFGKARGPTQAPNRRTSRNTREIWLGGMLQRVGCRDVSVTKMGRHLLRELTAKRGLCSAN